MEKYKPKDSNVFVANEVVYGTRDNDIFHITPETLDNVKIVPKNQATDSLHFDMKLDYITTYHANGTKDLIIIYGYTIGLEENEKTLIIKNWFTSKKATATKSSLKNIYYVRGNNAYNLSITNDMFFSDLYSINEAKHKATGSNFGDYVNLIEKDSSYTVNSGNGSDYIIGTNFDDTINSGNGNDYICGKNGNDILTGGIGTNTYAYDADVLANGNDTIKLTKGEIAKINYAGSSSTVEYKLDNKGNALIYFDKNNIESNYITLKDFAKKDLTNEIKFISTDNVKNLKETHWYYAPTDNYEGSYLNEHIDAKGMTTAKTDKKGNQIAYSFKTGNGNDIIESTNFADKITAGAGKNEIRYTSLNQLSDDTIYFTKNENLTIDLTGISGNNASATYALSGKNLVVTVSVENETPESFIIANIGTKDAIGTYGKITLIDKSGAKDLKEDALIVVNGTKGTFYNDIINGKDGNDTIKGGAGDDIISGGAGNDKLYGEAGENTIVFKTGDGIDTVYSGIGTDTLKFSGISIADLKFSRGTDKNNINDLIIKYSQDDSVTIKNYYAVNKKTELPITSVKYITTNEGTFYIDPLKIITGSSEIYGDNNANFILGSDFSDTIKAFDGNDVISGGKGADIIYGGDGDDYIDGGGDGDNIYGGAGNDIIYGGLGYDYIYGGDGDDIIYGGAINNDDIYTGTGNDTVNGGDGWNAIFLDTGNKTIENGHGNDDILVFLNETDVSNLKGYISGNDLIVADTTGTTARLVNYFTEEHSTKTLRVRTKNTSPKLNIQDLPIEITSDEPEVKGTEYKDIITSTNNNGAIINSYAGKDTIHCGDGDDTIHCGDGDDTINSGDGDDTIYSGAGNDIINAGTGSNTIIIGAGNKIIENGGGNDTIVISSETNIDNIIKYISGDNLILYDSSGNCVTLLNYVSEGHCVNTVKVGNTSKSIDDITIYAPNNVIMGTKNNDTLNGTENADTIYGNAGDDTINGGDGDDEIYGGAGDDTINGGDGDDIIESGTGDDTINGGAGSNIIYLDSGSKTIADGGGEDALVFCNETNINNLAASVSGDNLIINDSTGTSATLVNYFQDHSVTTLLAGNKRINVEDLTISITSAESEIEGTYFNDIIKATNDDGAEIYGNAGNDTIYGSIGDDTIDGGDDDDIIYGNAGADAIGGGAGNDAIYGGAGADTIDGGTGNDAIYGGDDNNSIYSGTGNDFINGGTGSNTLDLGAGNKTIINGGGEDILIFSNEADINDITALVTGNNLVISGNNTSVILKEYITESNHNVSVFKVDEDEKNIDDLTNPIESSDYTINGTSFHDSITASDGSSHAIYAGAGNDIIHGGSWNTNFIHAGEGNDEAYGGAGADSIWGEDGDDLIYGYGNNDIIKGDNGNDTIYGGDGLDDIDGGTGNDEIYGDAGNDDIEGGSGNDTIYGGIGNDTIKGSDGNDLLYGGEGNDTYILKENNLSDYDVIDDEAGNSDSLVINYNKDSIILRFDIEINGGGNIIGGWSENMYITTVGDFGNAQKGVKITKQFDGHSIESIKTADNYTLSIDKINELRSNIATWLYNNGFEGQGVQEILDSGDLTTIANLIAEFQKADWQLAG